MKQIFKLKYSSITAGLNQRQKNIFNSPFSILRSLFLVDNCQLIKSIFIAILCIPLTGCLDMLDQEPYSEVSKEDAIENVDDAKVALNGTYATIRGYWSKEAIQLGDIMTDEAFPAIGHSGFNEMQSYLYTASSSDVTNLWATLYQVVNQANNIIDVIDELDGDASLRTAVKGEALALRAVAYLELCKWFAAPYNLDSSALGVPIKMTDDANEQPQRVSLSDVYDYIESDLLAADQLLGKKTSVASNDLKYISSWSIKSFLARFYLYKGDHDKAIEYSTQVISSGKFNIYSNAADLSSMWMNDEGSEIIFMIGYTNTSLGGAIGTAYYDVSRSGAPKVNYAPTSAFLSLYTQFGPANNGKFGTEDIRYQPGTYFVQQTTSYNWNGNIVYKYPSNPGFTQKNMNQPKVIRIPELYLIRAEAYAATGDVKQALADYNYLRSKRIQNYINESSLSLDKLKQEIFNERLRELCFEGHYWYDLKRTGKGFKRMLSSEEMKYADAPYDLEVLSDSYKWLLPIPLDEIAGNPDIITNPGY